jgi:hypothetical protein
VVVSLAGKVSEFSEPLIGISSCTAWLLKSAGLCIISIHTRLRMELKKREQPRISEVGFVGGVQAIGRR